MPRSAMITMIGQMYFLRALEPIEKTRAPLARVLEIAAMKMRQKAIKTANIGYLWTVLWCFKGFLRE